MALERAPALARRSRRFAARAFALLLAAAIAQEAQLADAAPPPPPGVKTLPTASAPPPSSVPPTSRESTPSRPLRASERSFDPGRIGGRERAPVEPGDARRGVVRALLLPIRVVVAASFAAAAAGAKLAELLKLAPRADDFFSPRAGEVKLLPTIFFETRHPVSFGARVVAVGPSGEASLAVASGGPDDVFAQSVIAFAKDDPRATRLSFEGTYDRRNRLELLGVGQDPASDPRNVFRSVLRDGLYLERRSRLIATMDQPVVRGFSVIPSSSVLVSRVEDTPGSGPAGLSRVFAPTELTTSAATTRIVYGEIALRFFTRRTWVSHEPGAQLEAYAGYGTGILGENLRYVGSGGRAAVFVPVVRSSNTVSPKVVLDTMTPLGDSEVPFTALVRQPEYRGFDLRRDRMSLVVSLDYRWVIAHHVAARLFVDGATVAPRFPELFTRAPRVAAGFGLDIFSGRRDVARFAVSGSADGVRVLLTLGSSPLGGDRQHRN